MKYKGLELPKEKKKGRRFAIGVGLVQFLEEREIILLSTNMDFSEAPGKKKGYHYNSTCYAMCNFNFPPG